MRVLLNISTASVPGDVEFTQEQKRQLKRNPQEFASNLTLSSLVAILRSANHHYHDKGQTFISDEAYDALKDELRERKPDHKVLKEVGAIPTGRNKMALPFYLGSLDKAKPDSDALIKWLARNKGPYIISDKVDGASLLLDRRAEQQLYTRGRGKDGVNIGQNVTPLIGHLKIPKQTNYKHAVRGEAIMEEQTFQRLYSKTAQAEGKENARNLVSGLLNRLQGTKELKDVDFLAHELVYPLQKPSDQFKTLKKLGYRVVWHKVVDKLDSAALVKLLAERKKASPFNMDGLVVMTDTVHKRAAADNPDYAVAFKMNDEANAALVKVKNVVWAASRHGALIPRINIEPTRIGGVTINYTAGFNAFFVKFGYRYKDRAKGLPERPLGPGAIVKIVRSGDVIPHILEVMKGAKEPQFPKTAYTWKGQDVVGKELSTESFDKRTTHFFTTLGVEGIKLSTVSKLADAGLDSIIKIIKAPVEKFLEIEGFQQRSAQSLRDNIDKALKNVPLIKIMDGSGMFGKGIGTRKLKPLLALHPNILDYGTSSQKVIYELALKVPGYSTITAEKFAIGLPKFVKWFARTGIKPSIAQKTQNTKGKLIGQIVTFTGFRDQALESLIEQHGGTVSSGVTGTTTILLVKDKNSGSSKLTKAQDQGIKIMTALEFKKKYSL